MYCILALSEWVRFVIHIEFLTHLEMIGWLRLMLWSFVWLQFHNSLQNSEVLKHSVAGSLPYLLDKLLKPNMPYNKKKDVFIVWLKASVALHSFLTFITFFLQLSTFLLFFLTQNIWSTWSIVTAICPTECISSARQEVRKAIALFWQDVFKIRLHKYLGLYLCVVKKQGWKFVLPLEHKVGFVLLIIFQWSLSTNLEPIPYSQQSGSSRVSRCEQSS